jgi:hypothetical protein
MISKLASGIVPTGGTVCLATHQRARTEKERESPNKVIEMAVPRVPDRKTGLRPM